MPDITGKLTRKPGESVQGSVSPSRSKFPFPKEDMLPRTRARIISLMRDEKASKDKELSHAMRNSGAIRDFAIRTMVEKYHKDGHLSATEKGEITSVVKALCGIGETADISAAIGTVTEILLDCRRDLLINNPDPLFEYSAGGSLKYAARNPATNEIAASAMASLLLSNARGETREMIAMMMQGLAGAKCNLRPAIPALLDAVFFPSNPSNRSIANYSREALASISANGDAATITLIARQVNSLASQGWLPEEAQANTVKFSSALVLLAKMMENARAASKQS